MIKAMHDHAVDKPLLTTKALKEEAAAFAAVVGGMDIPELFGITDGKALGTFIEAGFKTHIEKKYSHRRGNAAKGIDFPDLNLDLKATFVRQPQSSCPFRDGTHSPSDR